MKIRRILIYLIFASLGFQQVLVINIGGSLKIYEISSSILLLLFLFDSRSWVASSFESIILFVFLVASPLLSFCLFYAQSPNLGVYYSRFPDANTLRYNEYFAPSVALYYCIICWIAFNEISRARWISLEYSKLCKLTVAFGTGISVYSIYCSIFVGVFGWIDPIAHLPAFIQRKGTQEDFGIRSIGFSQEPSFYIFFQAWIILLAFGVRRCYTKISFYLIFTINCVALILTFSASIVSLVFSVLIGYLLTSSRRAALKFFFLVFITLSLLFSMLYYLNLEVLFDYYFTNKILNFFSYPTNTLDSGSFRAYTSALGIEIFKSFPLFGVGVGASNYYMPQFQHLIPLDVIGIRLGLGEVPQSIYSRVLAEQGLLGIGSLQVFLYCILYRFYKLAKRDEMSRVFFVAVIFTSSMFLSIQPQYSLFIWAFLGLSLNYAMRKSL